MERRVLFSVIQSADGELEMEWHPDLYPRLDDIAPNGEVTDRILDIAEELIAEPDDEG